MKILGILLLLLLHQTCAAMEVYISPTQRTFRGSNVVLGCTFLVGEPSVEPSHLVIKWYFQSKEVLTYSNGVPSFQPRMSFSDRDVRNGDASLFISNVTIFDDGTYTCSVTYKLESKEKDTQLQILASPKVMITNKAVTENKASTMSCTATKFYPPDIKITWLRDNQLLQNSEMGEITVNDDRTFSVTSIVTITPSNGDQEIIFSCKVQHASLPEPKREDFLLDITRESNTVVIVGIIVGLFSLIFISVVGILLYKRYKSAPLPQTVQAKHPEPNEVYQLCPAEELLHPSTPEEHNMGDDQHQHPSPPEADVEEEPNDIGPPTDPCLPPTEDFSPEELDGFEIIDFSELPRYP